MSLKKALPFLPSFALLVQVVACGDVSSPEAAGGTAGASGKRTLDSAAANSSDALEGAGGQGSETMPSTGGAPAETLTLTAASDTTITTGRDNDPGPHGDKNHGARADLPLGSYDGDTNSRLLLRFEIDTQYEGREVESATLTLTPADWQPKSLSAPFELDIHRLLVSWKEGSGVVDQKNSFLIDGATAVERFWGDQDGSEDWSFAGVGVNDIDASAHVFATVTLASGSLAPAKIDITALAQGWLDNLDENHGLLIKHVDEIPEGSVYLDLPYVHSREASLPEQRPQLILKLK